VYVIDSAGFCATVVLSPVLTTQYLDVICGIVAFNRKNTYPPAPAPFAYWSCSQLVNTAFPAADVVYNPGVDVCVMITPWIGVASVASPPKDPS
jgi:hypothetical protein